MIPEATSHLGFTYEYYVLVGNTYCYHWFFLPELAGTKAGALPLDIIGVTNYMI